MKKFELCVAAICCGVLTLSSSAEEVMNEMLAEQEANSLLRIQTRTDEDTEVPAGRLYIFNDQGTCVHLLPTDETSQSATANLTAGTYQVYAVGGNDLSGFNLPSQGAASSTSEITLKEGQSMRDLLLGHEEVTVEDGETKGLNVNLQRQVFQLEQVRIQQVPEDVNEVEVLVSPLYQSVRLDGTFPDETDEMSITLTGSGSTWQAQPGSLSLPSAGRPTITIRFTTDTEVKSYAYTAADPIPANHKLSIDATYSEALGVTLTGTLVGTPWSDTPQTITFDFDEDNKLSSSTPDNNDDPDTPAGDPPVAGSTYKGCYVVSVGEHTATLLSTTEEKGSFTNDQVNTKLNKWSSGDGVTGTWRVPTEEEARTFLLDPNSFELASVNGGGSYYYFYETGSSIKLIGIQVSSQRRSISATNVDVDNRARLRPVIDITF